jgi:glycosyltransferase involved in cell wall biosynthesis
LTSSKLKPHILLIASAPALAGGERNLLDIAQFLVTQKKWQVSAVVPADGLLKDCLENLDCLVSVVSLPSLLRPVSVKKIAGFASKEKVNLIHAHGTRAAFYARPAAKLAGVPCVYTMHGIHYLNHFMFKRLVYLTVERFMQRWTSRLIFVCRSDMGKGVAARVAIPDASRVIYNGIKCQNNLSGRLELTVRQELGLSSNQKLILSVGRFHRQKGQVFLVEAAARLIKNYPNARFVFAGEGQMLAKVKQKTAELGLNEIVTFLGGRDDVSRLMKAADLFILPSLWEGLPYVLLEAAVAQLPVVATAVDGVPEVIIDGKTGILVPPGDSQALAKAILSLLNQPELARLMAKAGKEFVSQNFTLEKMCQEVVSVYKELLA